MWSEKQVGVYQERELIGDLVAEWGEYMELEIS